MISTVILILIYISFISLGLPDSLLGTSWPLMHLDFNADLSLLGYISLTTSLGTIISSLTYTKVCRFIKASHINCISTFITGFTLLIMSHITKLWIMFPFALILGIGAGAVDSSLNSYVAVHYKARHMSFLHAMWGIGTIFGPTLLSRLFRAGESWRSAYMSVSGLQLGIAVLLLMTIGLWKKTENRMIITYEEGEKPKTNSLRKLIAVPGVKITAFSTFLYCSIEAIVFIWTASFMTVSRGYTESEAALIVSMLYWGITIGRIATGLVNDRLGDDAMVLTGLIITLVAGSGFLFGEAYPLLMVSAFFIGFGFGPVFPSILHQSPSHFGIETGSAVTGILMSGAYVGSAFMPFLFGLGTKLLTPGYLPWMLLIFTLLQIWALTVRKKTFDR